MKTINEIKTFAETHTAVEFDAWCDENKVFVEWLDVTLTNMNDEYYNVYLPNYAVGVTFYDGVFEEMA
jgi:hypothetical protein